MATVYNIADASDLIDAYVSGSVSKKFPTLDVSSNSPFDDLYVTPMAENIIPLIDVVNENDMIMSLSNAEYMSDEVLEEYGYNNFNLLRNQGMKASTTLSVSYTRVSSTDAVIIPVGTIFSTEDGLQFQTTSSYTFTPEEMVASYNPITLLYTIGVNVTAMAVGTEYNVPANSISKFPNTFSVYVDSVTNVREVIDGTDMESKTDYANRLRTYYTTRYLGTKPGYESDIKAMIPGIEDQLIIGKGDPEMTRDLVTILKNGVPTEIHIGGKTDIYIKGSTYRQTYFSFELKSNLLVTKTLNSDVDVARGVTVIDMSDPGTEIDYTLTEIDKMFAIQISSTFAPTEIHSIRVSFYKLDGTENVSNFDCGRMTFDLETPFLEVLNLYKTSDTSIAYSVDNVNITRTDLEGNVIDSSSPFYMSSQEKVSAYIESNIPIPNNTNITIIYSVNYSVGVLREHYQTQENRVITADVLIKESPKKYVNVQLEVNMKDFEQLTDARKILIENAVTNHINALGIGDAVNESNIVASLYTDFDIAQFMRFVKMPLLSFYVPDDIEDPIENIRVESSSITPGTTEYIFLNKIRVVEISG